MGQSIPEWTKQYLRMDLAKLLEDSRPYPFKFFEGCLPQILLGLFLNTLPHMYIDCYKTFVVINALKDMEQESD